MKRLLLSLCIATIAITAQAGKTFTEKLTSYNFAVEEWGAVVTLADDPDVPDLEFVFYFQTKTIENNKEYKLSDMYFALCSGLDYKNGVDEDSFDFSAATYKQTYDKNSGKTTVTAKVTTDWDKNVYNITYSGVVATDLHNQFTDSPTPRFTKTIRNGRLVILNNDKTYNALGAEIQ